MQRSHLLGLLSILALVAIVAAFVFSRGDSALPPPAITGTGEPETAAVDTAATAAAAGSRVTDAGGGRVAQPLVAGDPELDPEIRAALTGFKGRVVDARKTPVPDCGVRIYRGAQDSVLPVGFDLFAEEITYAPNYIAGDTQTRDDGTFEIHGVWPRGFYLLFAGIGTDAPSHRVLPHAPGPGEIVDLGDVVLNDAAVATGKVVDEDGEPVAGALVRGVDLPGQIVGFFPIERIDPEGALLIRDGDSKLLVFEFPKWAKDVWQHLPIPTAHTAADGAFRLVGLVPGSNLIATTHLGFLSDIKPGVPLKAGQVKDLGTIRMKRGEELNGRVVDSAGKPVAGAEVLAGSTLSVAPVDLAMRVGVSDADGRFAGNGFVAGKVSVAARRTARDPWVLAAPQSILGEVTVVVPATFALTVAVTGADGAPVPAPKLRLLPGEGGNEIAVMATLGVLRSIDLQGRTTRLDDGRVRIDSLPAGKYTLLATDAVSGTGVGRADLTAADEAIAISLPLRIEYAVRVVGPDAAPIRNAAVYIHEQGEGRTADMPFCAGRTGGDGRLLIKQASSKELRVSATHPRWGTVNDEMKAGGGELVLAMQTPGWIEGVLKDHGKPPLPGKYTIATEWRPDKRGATEEVPLLATPRLDGSFALKALQPGRYRVGVISSLEALTSPGGVFGLAQSMFMTNELPHENVQVMAGQRQEVVLDIGEAAVDGPTGHVFGSVQLDGRLAVGHVVQLWTSKGRRVAKIDAAGRFDCGPVPVGDVQLNVVGGGGDGGLFNEEHLVDQHFALQANEEKEIVIDVNTASIRGSVLRPDGSPAAGVHVQARGRPLDARPEDGREQWHGEMTDQEGNFHFARVPQGVYRFDVHCEGDEPLRGRLEGARAEGGALTGLQIQLLAAVVVAGRIDMSVFPKKPNWGWVSFHVTDPQHPEVFRHVGGDGFDDEGRFSTTELGPGTYSVRVQAQLEDTWTEYQIRDPIVVPAAGLRDLLLRPEPMPPRQPPRPR